LNKTNLHTRLYDKVHYYKKNESQAIDYKNQLKQNLIHFTFVDFLPQFFVN